MPVNRFYSDTPLKRLTTLSLEESEAQHLIQVMRGKVGEAVEVVNGKGALANGTIASIRKREAVISLSDVTTAPPPSHKILLAQALPRINRLDFIIEKGTELGVDTFWIFPGERSERHLLNPHQLERLQHICIAAMKQSGRLWLPQIQWKPSLQNWDTIPLPAIFGDPDGKEMIPSCTACTLLVGPESGWSEAEILFMKEKKCAGVCLHENILRTDTAALAGIVLLNSHMHSS